MAEGRGEQKSPARRLSLVVLLAAPLAATPLAARAFADHIATKAGAELAKIGVSIRESAAHADHAGTQATLDPLLFDPEAPVAEPSRDGPVTRVRSPGERSSPELPPSPRRGILVRSAIVAMAVQSGARPSGTPVAASGMRPSGVALQGVGVFGSGLRDGDVVTAVGGTTTTSAGMVVAAVAGAVRAGAKAISAVIWRDQQEIRVTVELPRITRRGRADSER